MNKEHQSKKLKNLNRDVFKQMLNSEIKDQRMPERSIKLYARVLTIALIILMAHVWCHYLEPLFVELSK